MMRVHPIIAASILAATSTSAQPLLLQVEDILASNCISCHGEAAAKGGLRMHTPAALLRGGDSGAAVVPGDPANSPMLGRLRLADDDDERMPPAGKNAEPPLDPADIAALEQWIREGARWREDHTLLPRARGGMAAHETAGIVQLEIVPSDLRLEHSSDRQAFTVLATLDDGSQRDLTAYAALTLQHANANAPVRLDGDVLTPMENGAATLHASFGRISASAAIEVSRMETPRALGFAADVVPVLTRFGCNSGGCHGSARGQDGFHLSLFGYDPASDREALVTQMPGRRIDLASPAASLVLTKSVGTAAHSGGARFDIHSDAYRVVRDWIAAGAVADPPGLPEPTHITIAPGRLLLAGENQSVALRVRASYSDGTDRDVTRLAVFSTSNGDVAGVDEQGVVRSRKRGEAFVMARFHTFTQGAEVIVVPAGGGYTAPVGTPANAIDQLIGAKLARLRITPSVLCGDHEFLRRATLDIVGRLPTIEEQDGFAADTAPGRRERLVDRLLALDGFTDLWVMRFAELLQIRTNEQTGMSYKATLLYYHWLKDRIAREVPLDQIIRELFGASGGTFSTPQGNFFLSEMDPLKFPENVAQSLLGTRLQCAQCHNHPFDRWTMDDYYGWNAFFAQIGRKKGSDPREPVIFNSGTGATIHPVTKKPVPPKFLGGAVPDLAGRDRRGVLADWLTAPDNPWFSRNIANIVWAHFFGTGIVDPVDDVRLSNPPANPELLDALAKRLRDSRYNLKDLVRLIATSDAYGRSTVPNESNLLDERNFSRAKVRRIRAEVLYDVIAAQTLTRNKLKGLPLGARAVEIADGNVSNYFLTTFGRATRATACACEVKLEPNLSQALHLINGDTTDKQIRQSTLLRDWLAAGKPPAEIVTLLYRRALCRPPTAEELAKLTAGLPADPKLLRAHLDDVFWAVLNSSEFVFNH